MIELVCVISPNTIHIQYWPNIPATLTFYPADISAGFHITFLWGTYRWGKSYIKASNRSPCICCGTWLRIDKVPYTLLRLLRYFGAYNVFAKMFETVYFCDVNWLIETYARAFMIFIIFFSICYLTKAYLRNKWSCSNWLNCFLVCWG